MPLPVIALDFDGVIADSARESFDVALVTYSQFYPDSDLAAFKDPFHPGRRILFESFLEMMALGNRAEDYALALKLIEQGRSVEDQESYDVIFSEQDPRFLGDFHHRLYENRDRSRNANPEKWCEAVTPFVVFTEILKRRCEDARWSIVTAKDRSSVKLLLASYGLEEVFKDSLIFDKSLGRDKRVHLQELKGVVSVPHHEITFVDDKLNHLETAALIGAKCVLAAWGYNGDREQEGALRQGFEVASLDTIEGILLPSS